MEPLDKGPRLGVAFGIEPQMWMPIAREEIFETQHVAVISGTDNDGAAAAGFKQTNTTQDERPHNALAKFGFGDEQRTKLFRRNHQRFDVVLRVRIDQRG